MGLPEATLVNGRTREGRLALECFGQSYRLAHTGAYAGEQSETFKICAYTDVYISVPRQ